MFDEGQRKPRAWPTVCQINKVPILPSETGTDRKAYSHPKHVIQHLPTLGTVMGVLNTFVHITNSPVLTVTASHTDQQQLTKEHTTWFP